MILATKPNEVKVVKDKYSGTLYGNDNYAKFTENITNNIQYYSNLLRQGDNTLSGNSLDIIPYTLTGGGVSLREQYTQSLRNAQRYSKTPKSNYQQRDQIVESFDKDPEGWDRYFSGKYKNPRQAEANAERNFDSEDNALAIKAKSNLKTPKTVGTGVSTTGSINPFGNISEGLNI